MFIGTRRPRPKHRREHLSRRRIAALVGTATVAGYVALPAAAETSSNFDLSPAGSELTASSAGFDSALEDREQRTSRLGVPRSLQARAVEPRVVIKEKPEPKPKPSTSSSSSSGTSSAPTASAVAPVDGYQITATYGAGGGYWSSGSHTGLDLAAPTGTPLKSIKSGKVTQAGWDGAYGYKTVIQLADGSELWYCHQSSIGVSVGQTVSAGQVIGAVGATGNVTGPHLHLEYRPTPDTPADPYAALASWGVNL